MYFCTVDLNGRVMSGDFHTKQRPLAAGFKGFYPTERTEHATIVTALLVYVIIIPSLVIGTLSSAHWRQVFKAYYTTQRTEHATIVTALLVYVIIIPSLVIGTLSSAHWRQVFKAYYTTQRTEHATIARSDCAIRLHHH